MCGIFGVVGLDPDRDRLEASAAALRHRGPDHVGFWIGREAALLHTRLSLVDLSADSHQPFWDASGRHALVFNGEIYNFRELRAELAAAGIACRTSGDTEVLLAMLLHAGVERTLPRLEGMFAFALYDTQTGALTAARDRFGMKPLVYHSDGNRLLFASEVKALRPWIGLEADLVALTSFLGGFQGPTTGPSLFKDVRHLPPGGVLTASPGRPPQVTQFATVADLWDLTERERLRGLSRRRLVDELEARLYASVRSQLMADAPVGVFCSGGVDSSVVVAMASTLHANLAIFHADVEGRHSERSAAETLARHLKLDLRVAPVRDADFLDALPTVIAHSERPITIRPDSIPFFRVCTLVRAHGVKGVLSGEAADECFLGYQSMMPGMPGLGAFRRRMAGMGLRNLYRRLALGQHAEFEMFDERSDLSQAIGSRFEIELQEARHRGLRDRHGSPIRAEDRKTLDALGYHLRTLLHRNDTLGMAASIESRFPFLETGLVRLAVNLPHEFKIRRTLRPGDLRHPFYCDKWILRQVARRWVPRALSDRPKRAFPTNAFKRMRIAPAFFRDSCVAGLLALGAEERAFFSEHSRPLLQQRLLQAEVWALTCLCRATPDQVRERLHRHVTVTPDRGR